MCIFVGTKKKEKKESRPPLLIQTEKHLKYIWTEKQELGLVRLTFTHLCGANRETSEIL